MKKPLFSALLALLFALALPACKEQIEPSAGPTADPASKITASPAPSEKLTEVPTETPTETPTEVPTKMPAAAPTPKPIPYDHGEYDTLLAFFELKDENGVKNGEKCFKGYDPERVDFWGDVPFREGSSVLEWDENGNLVRIDIQGIDWVERDLVGGFELQGFDSLFSISMQNLNLESISVKDCTALACFFIRSIGDAIFSGDFMGDRFDIASSTHCRFEGGENSAEFNRFTADITVEGRGRAIIDEFTEDWGEFIIYVAAIPEEGHRFLGWYDADGKLISTEAEIELSYEHDTGYRVHDFTGIAKFE